MNRIVLGLVAGIIFGGIVLIPMLKMQFEDKRAALLGAFLNRFAIGFLIPNTMLPVDPIIQGLLIGLMLSLPDAIITKAYVPILVLGLVGGGLIGLATKLLV